VAWFPLERDQALKMERELQRELPAGHALYGYTTRAVARGTDCDDVAFVVDGARLCIVHLTWRAETDPRWPHTLFVDTLPEDD